jgi:hypothetical protein
MGKFLINTISYFGDNYFYNSPKFSTGVNIVEGKNRNGKTTLMNLLYYCLGGDVKSFSASSNDKHLEITSDKNNYVELDVVIFENRFILRRGIGNNYISISNDKGEVETYSVNRNENPVIFSDWLLDRLRISVLDIFQGNSNFKLNIKDLMRLIYHDQNPDPNKVFKRPDTESYVSDSEYVRKLIFQVLLGKSFEQYYSSIGKLKQAESDKKTSHALLKEFQSLSEQLYSDNVEVMNVEYLEEEIRQLVQQLNNLSEARKLLKRGRPDESNAAWVTIDKIKSELIELEMNNQNVRTRLFNKSQDLLKYKNYKDGIIKEVTQLNKIIHAHDTLNVFTPNSCPFCLGDIEREPRKCYCGNVVEEDTFEKFFFSSDEYWSLLKSRKKSMDTVDLVITSVEHEIAELKAQNDNFENKVDYLKALIKENLLKIDSVSLDVNKLNEIDDKSLKVKTELNKLHEKLEFELKLRQLHEKFDAQDKLFKSLQREVNILENSANLEMESIVDDFNQIYNEFMTSTLKDCRSAKIDSDSYTPIIDGGAYREASSKVAVRFNYYISMLKMSILNPTLKFPSFLMIDTPQTAGIDSEELKKLIDKLASFPKDSFQIILTTGHGLYPESLSEFVKETLTDENKLLKPKQAN